jgi:hypothetical protein
MRHLMAAIVVVAVVLPASSFAGIYFNLGFGIGCGGCGHARPQCVCPTPCYGCPPAAGPVLQSSYVPQQFVTYQDVPRTEIRRQAFVEQVPVTTYEQVTETVYVPQQVTRTIPRTVMTEQTRYRDVAFQTTQRIAQTQTRFVPQPTIGFAPVSGCNSCGSSGIGFAPSAIPGYPSVVPTADPGPASIPSMPSISVSPYSTPSLVPQYDDINWSEVRPRTAPTPSRSHAPIRGTSLFRPAPSAATVWQSRF